MVEFWLKFILTSLIFLVILFADIKDGNLTCSERYAMETTIDEQKLSELIDQAVQKHLKATFHDMEEVRRSPAAAIIRLEARVEAIEKNMVTRAEFADYRSEFKDEIWKLKLYIILLAILVVLTNPQVLELLGRLLNIFKP